MRKIVFVLFLVVVLALSLPRVAQAASTPVAGCPTGFNLMTVMICDQMMHTMVGETTDLNGDGYLCMSAATSTIHVHMDNTVPLP